MTVVESVTVTAPPRRVWHAVVDARARAAWWPWLDLDATVGSRFEERWTDGAGNAVVTSGLVVEAVPARRLRLTWADDGWPAATEVEITLGRVAGGTVVTVVHGGWDALPDGEALAAAHRAGWRAHLRDLAGAL